MHLTTPVTSLSGIGPIMAKKLAKLNIHTIFDLLYHLPFRYEDRTNSIIGLVDSISNLHTKSGKVFQKAVLFTDPKTITAIWFHQPFLTRTLKPGQKISLFGKTDFFGRQPALISPDYELLTDHQQPLHTNRIVPIYPETSGVSSKWLRSKIHPLLASLPDIPQLHLSSLHTIHFPTTLDLVSTARRSLAIDELFLLQLAALDHRQSWHQTHLAHTFTIDQEKIAQLISSLPFTLTPSQTQAITEILSDLSKTHPANRLLEGDVGSGKTIVATIAAYTAHLNGYQTLFLAPTQLLAHQHFMTLKSILNLPIALITSNTKIDLDSTILVGTHALLSDKLQLNKVGLVIIDEQHRFGVTQRALAASKGSTPHILTMTATPIPRTIALTLYGDLDLSVLSDLPSGRIPVKTWVVPESKRQASYNWILDKLKLENSQCFWVCPFIEESESLQSIKAVKVEFEKLKHIFPHHKLGLLHGKLKPKEKDEVLEEFRAGECDILVSTPVIEVGIDIPNASIIVIEEAQRFGLAQLHQLRGRVGRGHHQSYCLLFSSSPDSTRLKALETNHSGSALADLDLKLRGAGDIYGTIQHGTPSFKIATYEDLDLIQTAKAQAEAIFPKLDQHPLLRSLIEQDKIALINN